MKHTGWILAAVSLVLIQSAPARAGSLEVITDPGRVTLEAEEVPLGRIVGTLAERGGMHVLIDERIATQLVTVRLEAGGIQEVIVRLMREAGGGNYAIVRADAHGKFETLLFQDPGKGAAAAAQPSQPAYIPSPNLPAYSVYPAGGGAAYGGGGPEASYPAAPTPYQDALTLNSGAPKPSPAAGGVADATAPGGLDHSLLTEYQLEEKRREALEGRRGTKDLD